MKRSAIFLDRDGTINYDPGYLNSPDKLVVLPAARRGLKLLAGAGHPLFIVTNQSGIGRGLLSRKTLDDIHLRLEEMLAPEGVKFEEIAYCPHLPDDDCSCRKPSPKMILDLAASRGIEPAASFMIGDSPSDVESGRRAGCRTVLLADRRAEARLRKSGFWVEPDFLVSDLWRAALLIQRREKNR